MTGEFRKVMDENGYFYAICPKKSRNKEKFREKIFTIGKNCAIIRLFQQLGVIT